MAVPHSRAVLTAPTRLFLFGNAMSLEKIDIRCKFDPLTIAYVEAEANARDVDKCIVLREILDSWAATKQRAFMETQKRLRARGLAGAVEGNSGQRRAEELWEDEE